MMDHPRSMDVTDSPQIGNLPAALNIYNVPLSLPWYLKLYLTVRRLVMRLRRHA